jgi:hypothetical protein
MAVQDEGARNMAKWAQYANETPEQYRARQSGGGGGGAPDQVFGGTLAPGAAEQNPDLGGALGPPRYPRGGGPSYAGPDTVRGGWQPPQDPAGSMTGGAVNPKDLGGAIQNPNYPMYGGGGDGGGALGPMSGSGDDYPGFGGGALGPPLGSPDPIDRIGPGLPGPRGGGPSYIGPYSGITGLWSRPEGETGGNWLDAAAMPPGGGGGPTYPRSSVTGLPWEPGPGINPFTGDPYGAERPGMGGALGPVGRYPTEFYPQSGGPQLMGGPGTGGRPGLPRAGILGRPTGNQPVLKAAPPPQDEGVRNMATWAQYANETPEQYRARKGLGGIRNLIGGG